VSSTTVTTTVPWGMNPGVYTLTVVNAGGGSGSLPNAFTVTQGIDVWTTGGPYGGGVFAIAIHPTATSTLFAIVGYGLFRSQDQGESWKQVFGDLSAGSASVAIDPFQPNTVYLGTGVGTGTSSSFGQMVYRSDDRGNTWAAIPIAGLQTHGYPATHVFPHPLVEGTLYAAISQQGVTVNYEGLYKSENRGETWINWSNNLTDTGVMALAFHPINPQIMYLGTYNGSVFRTENGGSSWEFIGQPELYVGSLAVDPFGEHSLWLCGSSIGRGRGLWKYDGVSWTRITPVPGVDDAYALIFDPHQQGKMWLGTGSGGFTSQDGGKTWSPFAASMSHTILSLAVDPGDSQIVYQGYLQKGVYRTLDSGGNWRQTNHGLTGVFPNGLVAQSGNPQVVYAMADLLGLFKSSNGGNSWRALPIDLSGGGLHRGPIALDPFAPQRVVIGAWCAPSGVRISEDGGETWRLVAFPPPLRYQDCCTFSPQLVAASLGISASFVMGADFVGLDASYSIDAGGLAFSTDGGENWEWADLEREISPVVSLAFDPISPTVVYAGTRGPFDPSIGGNPGELLKSTDGGITWQSLRQNLGSWSVDLVAVEPGGAHRLFVYAGTIWRSSDGGQTWETMPRPNSYGFVTDLIFVPGEPPILYAATTEGLYRSTDGAQTWQRATGTLGHVNVHVLAAGEAEERVILYAVTAGGMTSGSMLAQDSASGETLVSAGVYRQTTRLLIQRVYLPLVLKK
jgi:photosystem II stability/assembly factor-like uncharacterized protein